MVHAFSSRCGGLEDLFFLCKFSNGQTHCGIPTSAKMGLASNEPTVLQVKLRLTPTYVGLSDWKEEDILLTPCYWRQ